MDIDAKGRRYLVTGGSSLIGSHLADVLLEAGAAEVRLLDNHALGTPETVSHLKDHPRVRHLRGDVLKLPELLQAATGVDGVFALAGYLTLPLAADPATGLAVNTLGMVNTLEACRFAAVRRIVFSSSVAVYGNAADHPMSERTGFVSEGLQPASKLYGASKLIGEGLCARYAAAHGLEYNALRFSSVYGARQHSRAVNAVFVARVCEQVRKGEAPVIDGDGSEVHDYVYVTDVARACAMAMLSEAHGLACNIATGTDTTHTEVARTALALCGRTDLQPVYREDRRAVRSAAGTRLGFTCDVAERALGWRPQVGLEEGMRLLLDWQRRG